ncbi:MAG: PCP reductase family protein [Candidatus Poribacteria bacterium]|nr:PCP reductase family protein [Candidatus Poribacteria bacterium]
MSEQNNANERLTDVEERLTRVENLLVSINEKLGQRSDVGQVDTEKAEGLKQWVTDYVSMRLQQLVPETCDHPDEGALQDGPYLDNTTVPCTEEVEHRVKRIPIPFVREMVVQRVADNARQAGVERVDIEFFEKAATF